MNTPNPNQIGNSGEETASRLIELTDSNSLEFESLPGFSAEPVILNTGEVFAGFEVRGKLGSGGMATVYRARCSDSDSEVALKLLNEGLVRDTQQLQRFRREAQLASRLRHPRVVTVHTYGDYNGCAYLSMQLIEGPSLAEVINQDGPLPPLRAAEVLEDVARAIDAAHQQRVIHRDLKPSNVMLHPQDGPLVLDFGLAKDMGRDPNLTETGEILGTPAFLAPEQVIPRGVPVDHRIDVYGLGATLFFTLTGKSPHEGDTALEALQRLLEHTPPRLRAVNQEIPAPLEVICAKALMRDPRDRYQTAADFADDLARYRAQEAVRARLPGRIAGARRAIRNHPLTSALTVALVALALASILWGRAAAAHMALRGQSSQGLSLLASAQEHAREGRYSDADIEFLQAMLVTKGAFLKAPDDQDLRDALKRVKAARAEYAESRGNWVLAEELRQNLARLEQPEQSVSELVPEHTDATIRVLGFRGDDSEVVFFSWTQEGTKRRAVATSTTPEVRLPPGAYLAFLYGADRRLVRQHLLVVDSGHWHQLRLDRTALPPPGVFTLPSQSVLEEAAGAGGGGQ